MATNKRIEYMCSYWGKKRLEVARKEDRCQENVHEKMEIDLIHG